MVGAAATVTSLVAAAVWIYQQQQRQAKDDDEDTTLPALPPHIQRDMYKEERFQRMLPLLTMNKPMYDNIMMQDPQGKALSTISMKKAKWYINKELADWVVKEEEHEQSENSQNNKQEQQQSIIRLRFQPNNNRQNAENNPQQTLLYNTAIKANRCVVCGATANYMRHYVVPAAYRTLFPDDYKTHLSHDVVLTCAPCHVSAEQDVHHRRQRLEAAVRTDPVTAKPMILDRHKQRIAKEAAALLQQRHHMPAARIAACTAHVRQFWQLDDEEPLGTDLLVQTSEMSYTTPNPLYIPGPVLVVQPLLDAADDDDRALANFVRDWRTFFLETCQPQYLPVGWSVDSAVRCDKKKRASTKVASKITTNQ